MGNKQPKELANKPRKKSKLDATPKRSVSSSEKIHSNDNIFRIIEGRRFHNEDPEVAKYMLPNDDDEQDRLQLQHYLIRYIYQSNYSAPVTEYLEAGKAPDGQLYRVLDVGCGPGTWVLEMASQYPAEFYGIDISPIFPTEIKPDNVTFQKANLLTGLPFPGEYFDYVHMRLMVASFAEEQWPDAVKELLRVCKVGGWLELMELNVEVLNTGPSVEKLVAGLQGFLRERGINPLIVPEIPRILSETNQFELPLHVIRRKIPVGAWAGKVGELSKQSMCLSWESSRIPISQYYGWTTEEHDKAVEDTKEEVEITQTTYATGRCYGRKKAMITGQS